MKYISTVFFFTIILFCSSCTKDSPYPYSATGPYDTLHPTIRDTIYGPSYAIYIPAAFTPDGDGVNETFSIFTWQISKEDFSCKVYMDQQLIFSSTYIGFRWDGNYEGRELPNRGFRYIIKYKPKTTMQIEKLEGDVYLLRH